jgi:hypothetical protein
MAEVEEGLKCWLKAGALPCFLACLLCAGAVHSPLDRQVVEGGLVLTFTWWTVSLTAFFRARAAHDSHQQLLSRLAPTQVEDFFDRDRAKHAAWYGGVTTLVLGLMVTIVCGPAATIDAVGPFLVPFIPFFTVLGRRVHESVDFRMARADKLAPGLIAEI